MDEPRSKVLIVEPDAALRQAVRSSCEGEDYLVSELDAGAGAVTRVESFQPDVVLVDLMLPDTSGFDICRELRRRGHRMPILILSSRNEEIDVVLGLEIGADDFIATPIRPREMLARIALRLRKTTWRAVPPPPDGEARLAFRGLVIDLGERRVMRPDGDVRLTHTEFDIIAHLARHAGQVVPRHTMTDAVWGFGHPMDSRVIDTHIRNLRRKIELDPARPRFILAVPGVGYRFAGVRAADIV